MKHNVINPPLVNHIFFILIFVIISVRFVLCCLLYLTRSQPQSISRCPSSPEGSAAAPSCSSDIRELGVVAELGGAQREACEGGRGGHVRVRRGEGRLELVGVVGVTWLVMRVDGRGGEEPVWVGSWVSRVVGVGADTQGHLVNYSASLGVGETVTVLEERWWGRARGQDGVRVVTGGEGGVGRVGQKGVCGQALGMCVRAG